VHKTIKRTSLGAYCGLQGFRERNGLMNLGNVELWSQMSREQPTKHPKAWKSLKTPNIRIKWTYPNESCRKSVGKKGTQATYIPNANHLFAFSFVFCFLYLPFFCFFYMTFLFLFSCFFFLVVENEVRISIIEKHVTTNCQLTI